MPITLGLISGLLLALGALLALAALHLQRRAHLRQAAELRTATARETRLAALNSSLEADLSRLRERTEQLARQAMQDQDQIATLTLKLSAALADAEALRSRIAERELALIATARHAPAPQVALTTLRGIGARVAKRLHAAGIHSVADLARLDAPALDQLSRTDPDLVRRIDRGAWVSQAQAATPPLLAAAPERRQ